MSPQTVVERITRGVSDCHVEVDGADCSFVVKVVSASFEGESPLGRQRRVLSLFAEELGDGRLHALTVIARTPQESATQ